MATILTFDSGLGGLTVYREVARLRPEARHVYAADDAAFPYGRIPEERLVPRILDVMDRLIAQYRPDLAVIACNTASTIALPHLRERFAIPFVGTVPAIKPACAASRSRMISVLGTEATVKREYTHGLIREFGQGCTVNLVGTARLAAFAEAELQGQPAADANIAAEIAPCFATAPDGRRTDTVVLACTHYPLLLPRLERLAVWPVTWLDPAPAIARRVDMLLPGLISGPGEPAEAASAPEPPEVVFTSGKAPGATLAAALAGFGLVRLGTFLPPDEAGPGAEKFDSLALSA